MSSSEVLFILAFIVLPTAILVSSIWAVVFIRRRPDPVTAPEEPAVHAYDDEDIEQTAVFASTPEPEPESDTYDDPPLTEHDVVVITANDPLAASPAEVHEEESEVAEPVIDAPQEFQRTADLDEVVTALQEVELETEPDDVIADVAVEEPVPVVEEPAAEPEAAGDDEPEPEFGEFSETRELPVIDPAPQPAEPDEVAEEDPEPRQERSAGSWRRRKQSVKLIPGDPDTPRARSRNREPQRQVPQINRGARRRDEASRNLPDDHEADPESPPGRD